MNEIQSNLKKKKKKKTEKVNAYKEKYKEYDEWIKKDRRRVVVCETDSGRHW